MNHFFTRGLTTAFLLGVAVSASAQSIGLASAAISEHQSVSLHNWRFDRVREVEEKTIRERCIGVDFHKAECRLITVDDAAPTDKQLERYAKATPQPVDDNLPNINPEDFVNAATLALAQTAQEGELNEHLQAFSFDGAVDEDEEYEKMGRQKGTMLVHREDGHIESLRLRNTDVFKPIAGVKIKTMTIDVEFVRVGEQVFASSVHMIAKGKAFGLKSIGEDQLYRFENFTPPQ